MITETRSLAELTQEGLRVLYNELGVVDTVRFLNQFTTGFGNYTEERRVVVEQQTFEQAVAQLRAFQTTWKDSK